VHCGAQPDGKWRAAQVTTMRRNLLVETMPDEKKIRCLLVQNLHSGTTTMRCTLINPTSTMKNVVLSVEWAWQTTKCSHTLKKNSYEHCLDGSTERTIDIVVLKILKDVIVTFPSVPNEIALIDKRFKYCPELPEFEFAQIKRKKNLQVNMLK